MIDDKFIELIPDDLATGATYIAEEFFTFNSSHYRDAITFHDDYMDFYNLFEAFLASKDYKFDAVDIDGDLGQNINDIVGFFNEHNEIFREIVTKEKSSSSKDRYNKIFSNSFMYEFSDGDLDRIQVLINELRDIIVKSELFDAKHQARLLRRLEKLQSELHKKVSDVDRFWGLVGDAGVALGKFGNDAKPIVDRIREITNIVWNTQSRSEELPSGTSLPKLGKDDDN